MGACVLALMLAATPGAVAPGSRWLPSSFDATVDGPLQEANLAGGIECKGRRCSTDFALSMELKERPAGTLEQRLRSEVARKDHPGGPGRLVGPVHHVGRLWTARWDRGFVSLVEVGERDLWLWLISPAAPNGADREWEEVGRSDAASMFVSDRSTEISCEIGRTVADVRHGERSSSSNGGRACMCLKRRMAVTSSCMGVYGGDIGRTWSRPNENASSVV